jgi:DNA-binding NarL/FixJ family response regulator
MDTYGVGTSSRRASSFGSGDHLSAPAILVLVVDDYEPIRRFVCSTIRKREDFQIVGEASDGLEAVRRAEELKPDLVVLDIGLPGLNGMEVARRIRKLSPCSKILFLSQEYSAAVAEEAFRLGAMGYVAKADAGSDLLAAMEAVCQGRRFASKRLKLDDWASDTDAQAPDHLFQKEVSPSLTSRKPATTHSHEVHFYSDDAAFVSGLTHFIEAVLKSGNPIIAVATESHRMSLLQSLLARGVDVPAAVEQGLYFPVDVEAALATFMVNDLPDPERFRTVFGDLLTSVTEAQKDKRCRVAACGEFAPTLWAQGKADAAIQVEHLTDEIAKTRDVDILCGYVLSSFPQEQVTHMYSRICAEHSAVRSY